MNHLGPLPVLLPLLGAGATLMLVAPAAGPAGGQRRRCWLAVVAIAACCSVQADHDGPQVLWIGAWPAPLGIRLVADRLSALMLLVSAVVTLAVLAYSVGQGMTGDEREDAGVDLPPDVPGARRRGLERVPGR